MKRPPIGHMVETEPGIHQFIPATIGLVNRQMVDCLTFPFGQSSETLDHVSHTIVRVPDRGPQLMFQLRSKVLRAYNNLTVTVVNVAPLQHSDDFPSLLLMHASSTCA